MGLRLSCAVTLKKCALVHMREKIRLLRGVQETHGKGIFELALNWANVILKYSLVYVCKLKYISLSYTAFLKLIWNIKWKSKKGEKSYEFKQLSFKWKWQIHLIQETLLWQMIKPETRNSLISSSSMNHSCYKWARNCSHMVSQNINKIHVLCLYRALKATFLWPSKFGIVLGLPAQSGSMIL